MLVLDVSDGDEVVEIARAKGVQCVRGKSSGLIADWRACFHAARAAHPAARYFAWGSDHDRWDALWLDGMRGALDRDPRAVAAYPFGEHVDSRGNIVRGARSFAATERFRAIRFVRTLRRMVAGDMVYGLFRVDALERCGVFRDVLLPDRLLLAELSLEGTLVQVPRVLWRRQVTVSSEPTLARQRRTLFPRPVTRSLVPWWFTHAVALARARRPIAAYGYSLPVPMLGLARAAVGLSRAARER